MYKWLRWTPSASACSQMPLKRIGLFRRSRLFLPLVSRSMFTELTNSVNCVKHSVNFFMRIIPDNLKEVRKSAGLTMAEFAAKIGVSKPYVSMLESGKRLEMYQAKVEKLCSTFGVDPSFVVHPVNSGLQPPDRAPPASSNDWESPSSGVPTTGKPTSKPLQRLEESGGGAPTPGQITPEWVQRLEDKMDAIIQRLDKLEQKPKGKR